MEQPDKRTTKRVKKEGNKKEKRKRSKKKKDDKKKDSGKIKVKIEGRNGTTPRPFVGDGVKILLFFFFSFSKESCDGIL